MGVKKLIKCELKSGTSKKGNNYSYLDIELVPGYHKRVFLDLAELALVQLNTNNNERR